MLPTQYLEFRDSPSGPGSQWYAWHLGVRQFACACQTFSIPAPSPHTKCQPLGQAKMPPRISKFSAGVGGTTPFAEKDVPAASVHNEFSSPLQYVLLTRD